MIMRRIAQRTARVGVMGMGYVGLPLSVAFVRAGFRVTGFDVDARKVARITRGDTVIVDVDPAELGAAIRARTLIVTTDFSRLRRMDAIIICVPTPLRKTKDPDISYIMAAVRRIAPCLKKGQLIILESTTYPGTTREVVLPLLQKAGTTAGSDFFLAFSPERVDPGNTRYGLHNTPKIVGGITPRCAAAARALYETVAATVMTVSSPEAAEMVKLLENTFRAVNIGLVNEVALMCDTLGLNTGEIIDAAASKPFGFMPFYPGPGIGGHCIPLDPHYLSWKLKALNYYPRFIELASEINAAMPQYVVRRVQELLNRRRKALSMSRILVLGVAYKRDVSDIRESPALDIISMLAARQAAISYHDPFVPRLRFSGGAAYRSVPLTSAVLAKQDCVIIVTDHSCFDYERIVSRARSVFDCRHATNDITSATVFRL